MSDDELAWLIAETLALQARQRELRERVIALSPSDRERLLLALRQCAPGRHAGCKRCSS